MDCGLAVNPALVENQIVGQVIQSVSRVLKEEVTFDKNGVTSLDWVSYPILRFAEHPDVVPVVVQRLDEPSTGAGEEVMGATAAAIANAFFDATGVRLRQYPMTPERVKAALAPRGRGAKSEAARGAAAARAGWRPRGASPQIARLRWGLAGGLGAARRGGRMGGVFLKTRWAYIFPFRG